MNKFLVDLESILLLLDIFSVPYAFYKPHHFLVSFLHMFPLLIIIRTKYIWEFSESMNYPPASEEITTKKLTLSLLPPKDFKKFSPPQMVLKIFFCVAISFRRLYDSRANCFTSKTQWMCLDDRNFDKQRWISKKKWYSRRKSIIFSWGNSGFTVWDNGRLGTHFEFKWHPRTKFDWCFIA